jgi:hypothetical protein
MSITAALCNSYKQEIFQGTHASGDVYKIALFPSSATLSKSTTAYSSTGEVANGNGYATGGATLSGFSVTLDTDTAILDWTTDPTWAASSITARGALIYNSSKSNKAVAVLDFGADITSTSDTFTVTFPTPAAATGLIRIA